MHHLVHHREIAICKALKVQHSSVAGIAKEFGATELEVKEIFRRRAKEAETELSKHVGLPGFDLDRAMKSAGWNRQLR